MHVWPQSGQHQSHTRPWGKGCSGLLILCLLTNSMANPHELIAATGQVLQALFHLQFPVQTRENHLTGSLPFPAETARGSAHVSHVSTEKTEGFGSITHYINPPGTFPNSSLKCFQTCRMRSFQPKCITHSPRWFTRYNSQAKANKS